MKRWIIALLALALAASGAALAEADPLAARYLADAAGYYTRSVNDGSGWVDCVYGAQSGGEPLYRLAPGESILACANGALLVQEPEGQTLRRASDGAVLFSTAEAGANGFATPANYRDMLADGWVMVYAMQESLDGVSYALGVLDLQGQWVQPLSGDHALLTCGLEVDSDLFTSGRELRYVGEGRMMVSDYSVYYRQRLYDMLADAVYELEPTSEDGDVRGWLVRKCEYSGWTVFRDGLCPYRALQNGWLLTLDARGGVTPERAVDRDWLPFPDYVHFDGQRCADGRFVTPVYCKQAAYLVYSDGELRQLGTFRFVDVLPCDGFWMATGRNSEGTVYYFGVDTEGAFTFSPVRTEAVELLLPDGRVLECTDHSLDQYGEKLFIGFDGAVRYAASEPRLTLGLNNGVLCEYEDNAVSGDEPVRYLDVETLGAGNRQ